MSGSNFRLVGKAVCTKCMRTNLDTYHVNGTSDTVISRHFVPAPEKLDADGRRVLDILGFCLGSLANV